jgi:hypothetical protein
MPDGLLPDFSMPLSDKVACGSAAVSPRMAAWLRAQAASKASAPALLGMSDDITASLAAMARRDLDFIAQQAAGVMGAIMPQVFFAPSPRWTRLPYERRVRRILVDKAREWADRTEREKEMEKTGQQVERHTHYSATAPDFLDWLHVTVHLVPCGVVRRLPSKSARDGRGR